MADIKKYRVCTQSAPAGYMITDAAMRLPQPKEKTPTTVGVFNGNPFAVNAGRPFMADIKKYRVCTQSAPAGYMITDAAMRLPQPKEKTPTTVGVFNGNPFEAGTSF